jgi:hypothetical protein
MCFRESLLNTWVDPWFCTLVDKTRVTGSFPPPPPRFEAPKLDPGGCVPEASSEARLKKLKRDSPSENAIPAFLEAFPLKRASEGASRTLQGKMRTLQGGYASSRKSSIFFFNFWNLGGA